MRPAGWLSMVMSKKTLDMVMKGSKRLSGSEVGGKTGENKTGEREEQRAHISLVFVAVAVPQQRSTEKIRDKKEKRFDTEGMQQHLMQMQPMMAAYYPNNVTTDHIQQFLDENKSLILKIVESQNTGKLTECAENQARLQRNLMYLAAIADSQPQPPTVHAQYSSTGILQPGANYLQHQQAQQMSQQSLMAARSSLLYPQHPYTPMQQQQQLHGQLGMSSGGSSIDLQLMHSEAASSAGCGGGLMLGGFPDFGHGKDAASSEGRGGSSGCQNGNGSENHYLKAVKDPN